MHLPLFIPSGRNYQMSRILHKWLPSLPINRSTIAKNTNQKYMPWMIVLYNVPLGTRALYYSVYIIRCGINKASSSTLSLTWEVSEYSIAKQISRRAALEALAATYFLPGGFVSVRRRRGYWQLDGNGRIGDSQIGIFHVRWGFYKWNIAPSSLWRVIIFIRRFMRLDKQI